MCKKRSYESDQHRNSVTALLFRRFNLIVKKTQHPTYFVYTEYSTAGACAITKWPTQQNDDRYSAERTL